MAESRSKLFTQALEPERDRLYGLALARGASPGAAEGLLQRAVRQCFRGEGEAKATDDPVGAIEAELKKAAVVADAGAEAVMPADVWARLTAAAQIEAARSGGEAVPGVARALNPESVLLLPDPLLAPKRPVAVEEALDGLNLSPPWRFLVAAGIAVVLGIVLTTYIVTRHPGSSAATAPAATAPGAASAPGTATAP